MKTLNFFCIDRIFQKSQRVDLGIIAFSLPGKFLPRQGAVISVDNI